MDEVAVWRVKVVGELVETGLQVSDPCSRELEAFIGGGRVGGELFPDRVWEATG
jgi:hypothetical protein